MSTQPLLERFGKGREDTIVKRGGEGIAVMDGENEIEVRITSNGEKEGEMGVRSSWLVIRRRKDGCKEGLTKKLERGVLGMFTSSRNLNYKPLKINFMITFKPTAKQLFVYLLLQHTLRQCFFS